MQLCSPIPPWTIAAPLFAGAVLIAAGFGAGGVIVAFISAGLAGSVFAAVHHAEAIAQVKSARANRDIAELLALEAERSEGRKQRALRRASRSALMWPEEAAAIQESGQSLTELRSVGPFTAHFISAWLREAPDPPVPPPLRDGFLTYAYARSVVEAHPEWRGVARADHQMHTEETDGSSTIEEMAAAAALIGRERIAITDHSKTLRITNGMDEARLRAQGDHIAAVNARGLGPLVLQPSSVGLLPPASRRPTTD